MKPWWRSLQWMDFLVPSCYPGDKNYSWEETKNKVVDPDRNNLYKKETDLQFSFSLVTMKSTFKET
jgi:hypothetical protein